MPDTQRSKSSLATLLADNTGGDISPQDVRDFLESMDLARASLYVSTSSATTIASAGTWTKAAGTTTSVNLNRCTMPADNRLTYTGSPDVHGLVECWLSLTAADDNQVISVGIAENGTIIASSEVQHKMLTGTDVVQLAVAGEATLSTTDYVELFVKNNTSDANVTVTYAYMRLTGLFQ